MPNIHTHSRQHSEQRRRADASHASQTPPLSLTFPKGAAHHHRAAVQSNEVYPTPPASARRVSFGWASDKRFPLCKSLHSSLLQLAAACIGIVGSLFFAIGVVRQNADFMAHLAGSYWDSNPHVVAALAAQKADYLFGGGTIMLAFVVQLGAVFAPTDSSGVSTGEARFALFLAVFLTAGSFALLHQVAARLAGRFERQINESMKRRLDEQAGSPVK